MALTLTAIALEVSNGSEEQSHIAFTVEVAPKADTVEILAENVSMDGTGTAALELNVRMADDSGLALGENPPEQIEIEFTSVPTGVSLLADGGGSFTNPSAGRWIFTGTEAEANAIKAEAGDTASGGTYVINLSAVTRDGADTLATAVTDSFQLTIPSVVAGTGADETLPGGSGIDLIYGLLGNDILTGGGGNDLLVGGGGTDTLTGGAGSDRFQWQAGELGTGTDAITDFTGGAGGDGLDISRLLSGFDPVSSALDDFVRLSEAAGNTTIEVDADGGGDSFQTLAVIQGVTGLDADNMRTNGNLIV
jgi:Ca2+-binding RTX toxin-like protein